MCMFACVWAEMGTHVDKLCIHILILAVLRGSGRLHVSQRETWSWVKTFLVLTNGGRLFRGYLWHHLGEGERDCRMGYTQTAAHPTLRTAKRKTPTGSQLRCLDMRGPHNPCLRTVDGLQRQRYDGINVPSK